MENIVILSGTSFLFRFLPAFLILYWLTPAKFRNAVIYFGSIVFYACGSGIYVLLLVLLTLINYMMGLFSWHFGKARLLGLAQEEAEPEDAPARSSYIAQRSGRKAKRRTKKQTPSIEGEMGFVWAVALDIAVLIVFKVLALKVNAGLFPLGLSFYIFKMIAYQADLALGRIESQPTFMQTAAYFTLFTQVTQGPIMRYSGGGFSETKKFSLEKTEEGLAYLILGLAMKVLIADRIAILWNEIGKIGYESVSTPLAWLGAYSYTFELYFDFWGYSLIAAGAGLMMGMEFTENFHHPYAAVGVGDFYRRWHMTLGSWFRDYVYIPLGGSRKGSLKTIRNLMTVWILTGLWHGGTINFLLWGAGLGVIIVLEKYPLKFLIRHVPLFGRLETWILIPLSWVVFAISDLTQLQLYFTRLFPMLSGSPVDQDLSEFLRLAGIYWPYFAAAVLLCIPAVFTMIMKKRRSPAVVGAMTVLLWVCVYFTSNAGGNTFMYLNF